MARLHAARRNTRLLVQSVIQHVRDDPALLAIQISRRLPLALRSRAGHVLARAGGLHPRGAGLGALGAMTAGDEQQALEILGRGRATGSRLGGEVAVLLDRADLVPAGAAAATRARGAWASGDLSGAVRVLEDAGVGDSRQAALYRNELRLLDPGMRLRVTRSAPVDPDRSADPARPLRVLHLITNSLPHTQSGYSLRTHNVLGGLRDRGIDSVALTRTGYPVMIGRPLARDVDVVDGIPYHRALPSSLGATPEDRLAQEVQAAAALVREHAPHVLHATTDYRNALVARALGESTGIPWIYEVRGLMEQTWIASRSTPAARAAASRSEKARLLSSREGELAREAAAVVTLSRTMADQLVERGVDPRRITLVPNGVDETLLEERLSPDAARRRVGLALPEGAFAVGALSALVDYEGFDVLLAAAARILGDPRVPRALRARLHVVLVGDGVSAPRLLEQARALGIDDRVHLPGRVPRGAARQWVQALDVVAVPRLDREVTRSVTPQKPIEALALGRPVVLSDLPALRETVTAEDGSVHGVLVPPESPEALAEAVLALAEDDDGRARRARDGRRLAAERTWPAMMRRYAGVYRSAREASQRQGRR